MKSSAPVCGFAARAGQAGATRAPRFSLRSLGLALAAVLVLGGGALPVRAQSPEDRYLRAYALLEEADKLKNGGQAPSAVTKYLEAQVALKGLREAYPEWNTKLVAYRLEDIAGKLEPLTRSKVAPAGGTGAGSPSGLADQLLAMRQDLDRLTAHNSLLQAKLREALTVQPAAVDPRELANAEVKIKQLQKERDLLNVTLEQSSARGAGAGGPNMRQTLVTQSAVASVLQKQNEELLRQISELTAKLKGATRGTASPEALALRETVAALEASNRVMKEEQVAMENRLKDFVRQHGTAATQRQGELERQLADAREAARIAQKERDELIEKLNAVTRQLNQPGPGAPTPATQALEHQLEAIRAKLQIFEARNVPYTAAELALFKPAPLKLAATQTNTGPARPAEAPLAASPLLAQAARAIESGRYPEAEQNYQALLRQDPTNVFVMTKLAAAQMDQEKAADAETTLQRALQLDPQNPGALYLLGGLRLRQENYDAALEALSLSAKLDPDRAQTQYFLGQALIHQGSRGPAESALRRALELKPGWGDAHYLLAVLYAQEPNFRGLAHYHYNQAIAGGVARNSEIEKLLQQPTRTP